MLNLFQAELPIGRRLWLVLLAAVLYEYVVGQRLPLPVDSVELIVGLLVFFGYISVVHLPVFLPAYAMFELILWVKYLRRSQIFRYRAIVDGPAVSWTSAISDATFVIATLFGLPHFGQPAMYRWGPVGLVVLVLVQVLYRGQPGGYDMAELREHEPGMLNARVVVRGKSAVQSTISGNWMEEVARLVSRHWEIVHISE